MKTTVIIAALTLAASFLCWGCGGSTNLISDGGGSRRTEYVGTQAPGDVWTWSFEGQTFTGRNETLGFAYAGTAVQLPSGFKKLTMTSSTDPGVSVGDRAFAIEIPGTCLLVKPAGGDRVEPIFGTGLGANPTEAAFTMNWVAVPRLGYRLDQDDAYGVASFTRTEPGYTVAIEYAQLDWDTMDVGGGATLVPENGRYVVAGEQMVFGLQASGVFFGDKGPNLGGLIGFRQPTAPIPWADVATGTYIGTLVKDGQTQLVRVQPGDPGSLVARRFGSDANVETDTLDSTDAGAILRLASSPAPGLLRLTIESGSSTENLVAIVAVVEGRRILFCLGGSIGVGSGEQSISNLMLVQRD
jgi:hypothetical protein